MDNTNLFSKLCFGRNIINKVSGNIFESTVVIAKFLYHMLVVGSCLVWMEGVKCIRLVGTKYFGGKSQGFCLLSLK